MSRLRFDSEESYLAFLDRPTRGRPSAAQLLARESQEAEALIGWCSLHERDYPELALLFHIPNEAGTRHVKDQINLIKRGLKKGVPDYCLPVARGPWHGLFLELKTPRGKPSPEQIAIAQTLTRQGYFVAIANGWQSAVAIIESYLRKDTP